MKNKIFILLLLLVVSQNVLAQYRSALPVATLSFMAQAKATKLHKLPLLVCPLFTDTTLNIAMQYCQKNRAKKDSVFAEKTNIAYVLNYDFYTTLTAIQSVNSKNIDDANNIYAYYNANISSNFTYRKLKWNLYMYNDWGARKYWDSTSQITQDQLDIKNTVYYPIFKNKLYTSFSINTKTRLWHQYQYRTNSTGTEEKYLYETYMSPGFVYYSGGFTYEMANGASLQLALGSSQLTRIKNQNLFAERQATEIAGVPVGKRQISQFGINYTHNFPIHKYGKHLFWENYLNAFVPSNKLSSVNYYTLDLNNAFHILLLKYVRLSWRTKLAYNHAMNPKPVIINQLSVGFYLSNQL